jgi:hypothetical protein
MTPAPPHSPQLAHAQLALDRGRYAEALGESRALTADEGDASQTEVLRVRATAAFRLGELDDASRVAARWIDVIGRDTKDDALRIDMLAISVVASGEIARYDQSIEHLQMMQSAAARAGSFSDYVRARGTAANAFALLGDPWAGQRLLSELSGMFLGGTKERQLEATVRTNHASVSLQIARLARQGGDPGGCEEALEHASASLERAREIAKAEGEPRVAAFADVHASELALLRDEPARALELIAGALADADAAQLWAHARQLRLLEAEALLVQGNASAGREHLDVVGAKLDHGHEVGVRIRYHWLMQRALKETGDLAGALDQFDKARSIMQYRQYRQARAQSRFLRTRLELEHLYRFRGSGARGTPSRPGPLSKA